MTGGPDVEIRWTSRGLDVDSKIEIEDLRLDQGD